jgi:hypothetical protein
MKRKIIWIIIFTILFILFVLIVKPIRTTRGMENIAKEMLMKEGPLKLFSNNYEPIYNGIEGPKVIDRQDRIEYIWFKVLEWGDTASISAFVYKNFLKEISGILRKKNPPSVTADIKWYYVYMPKGISEFKEILPKRFDRYVGDFSVFKICPSQKKIGDSINLIVDPNRLLFFLKKGHFQIVEKNDIYTIIDFYEPIANIVHRQTNNSISTMSAKVFINDSLEVLILPCVVPIDFKNKK